MTPQDAITELAESPDKSTKDQWDSMIASMLNFDHALYRNDRQKFLDEVVARNLRILNEAIQTNESETTRKN